MRDNQYRFLTLRQLPARLNAEQAAWILGCQSHDVPVLVSNRLLKPMGNPRSNAVKYFATSDVVELSKDPAWLNRVTAVIGKHWQMKNARKKQRNAAGATLATVQ